LPRRFDGVRDRAIGDGHGRLHRRIHRTALDGVAQMTFDPDSHVHTVKEIDTARGCVRQWACKYLHRLPDPKHPNAQEGIDLHETMHRMLTDGPAANTQPESKVGKWARALYPLTPAGALPEIGQTFPLPAHWDLQAPRSSFKIDWIREDFSGFGDFKSIKNLKYALDEKTIHFDLQANLESFGWCTQFSRSNVDILWLYVQKDNCQTRRVPATITLAAATSWLEANALPWMRLIEQLRQVQPLPPVQAFPHERIACDKGGRGQIYCSFLGACQFRPAPVKTDQLLQLAARR
jgi:hypothetical protein